MIRRFTSAQIVPANAGAKAKNPVSSTLFSTPMVALLRHADHKILRTCCHESVRKRLKEAGAEGLSFELLNRGVDQPYKFVGIWLVDEWSKIGLKVTQRVVPTGPYLDALRSGNFEVFSGANCHGVPNPLMDVQPYLPGSFYEANYGQFEDQVQVDLYNKMLRETDLAKQRAQMREFEKYTVDTEAHEIFVLWWNRIIPYQSYVKGWKISPSHYLNQDLATVWLDR